MEKEQIDMALKVLGIVVLLFVILFILTWAGPVKCKDVSEIWCDVYDMVVGSPRVLIVYGEGGLGEPEVLKTYLQDPRYVGVGAVDIQHVDRISLGNLKKYKLVIVEQARKLSADQLYMFMEYVTKNGGRLVWVGDSGVDFAEGEVREINDVNTQKKIAGNPWIRIKEDADQYSLVSFDEFLGLRYVDRYCEQVNCTSAPMSVGRLESESTGEHPLIFGTSPQLNFKITKDRDFVIVKQIANSPGSSVVLNLNHGGVGEGKTVQIPKNIPIIATSSLGLGERVAYYAYPPEWFLSDNNYFYYVKNMYYGMLGR
jgi:hypothetical protein